MGKRELPLEHADALGQGLIDIGRASKASGVSVKMIRHYEAIGLLGHGDQRPDCPILEDLAGSEDSRL